MDWVKNFAELSISLLETAAIVVILLVVAISSFGAAVDIFKRKCHVLIFRSYRYHLFQGILLGLEFLVAADIINTVIIKLSFKTVAVLSIIILIRTFLSFTLELEMTGNWHWEKKN